MKDDEVQLTVRLQYEIHRALKFAAVDQSISMNRLVENFILQGLRECRVSVPTVLLRHEEQKSA
jgi:predicted HicB family RNase H-like nuclease